MTASELIKNLQELLIEHGDLDVYTEYAEITHAEFNADDGEVFVLA